MPKVVIAAGGTAGHVVPALAVADALRDSGAEVEFVGGERAEAELVPAAGFPFHQLRVEGIDRRNPLRAARAVVRALPARRWPRAAAAASDSAPTPCMGGGGYVAGPVGLAARTLRLPLVLTEADSHLGITNRLLARSPGACSWRSRSTAARASATRWSAGRVPAPAPGSADRDAARGRFGIAEAEPCLLVFGGSLGARRLNEAALDAFGDAAPGAVLHAAGRRDHDELAARLDELGLAAALPPARLRRAVRRRARGRRPGGGPRRAARCWRWPRRGCRRCSCPTRTPPPTTRPRTRATWSAPARRWWCPTTSSTARGSRARWARCWGRPSGCGDGQGRPRRWPPGRRGADRGGGAAVSGRQSARRVTRSRRSARRTRRSARRKPAGWCFPPAARASAR